jgi:hypothetical protein
MSTEFNLFIEDKNLNGHPYVRDAICSQMFLKTYSRSKIRTHMHMHMQASEAILYSC